MVLYDFPRQPVAGSSAKWATASSRDGNPIRYELTSPVIRFEIILMGFRIAIIASEMVLGGETLQ